MPENYDEYTAMILAIDPGLSGALALYNGDRLEIFDMPIHKITVNKKIKRQIDLYALSDWMRWKTSIEGIHHAHIEAPNSMPQQGITSAFNFGFSCGVVQMAVAAFGIPSTLHKPATWKKAAGLTNDKDACRRRASQLMPNYSNLWIRAKDDGRAESALLAYWAFNK